MKKHDEGYVLTLVLVVILVITLVGTAIMTGATRNIVAQHNSVEQMKDQYAAEGMIEILVSRLEDETEWDFSGVIIDNYDEKIAGKIDTICTGMSNDEDTAESPIHVIKRYQGGEGDIDNPTISSINGTVTYTFTAFSVYNHTGVSTRMALKLEIDSSDNKVKLADISYISYQTNAEVEEVKPNETPQK